MSGKATYDVAIYGPACAQLYLDAPAGGGAERQLVLLARGLAREGMRVCHVVSHSEGLPESRDGVDLVAEQPIRQHRLPGALVARAFEALSRADARVYVQRSAGLATALVGAFARWRGRRFVYSTASALDLTASLPHSRLERLGFRLGLPLADAIVVQTADQAAAAKGRRNVTHIPSLCEPAAPLRGVRDLFLWVGRPAAYKNPLAFVELARNLPEAKFVMVGCAEESLACLARVFEPPENLELLPMLSREELLPLYSRALAVVNTSDFEGFPNTFLEGWAHGALALSLRVDPDAVITRQAIGFFADGSFRTLADAARRLWHERGTLEEAHARATAYVHRFHDSAQIARRWRELLEQL